MPIDVPQRPREPSPAAIEANRRGVQLHAQGRTADAIRAFREGIDAQPGVTLLHVNLALVLAESGELPQALEQYERALSLDSENIAALNGLGSLHVRMGQFSQARACYERALALAPEDLDAHQAMYELEQIDRNIPKALSHQRRVLQQKALFSHHAPQERRRLLALMTPGDWQANVPIDFLIDRSTTTLHKLYILSPEQSGSIAIPSADAVFVAVGESDEAVETLALAADLVRRSGLPCINQPRNILATGRVHIAQALARIANVHAPRTARVRREELAAGAIDFPFPLIVRPVGSHAGHGLARIDGADELRTYLESNDAQTFYVMPFVDFRSPDGYYRKYRIIVVDGVPYAYHLAISPEWMIHYYNAPMRETPWMREEEAYFLSHFEDVFGPHLQQAFREIAQVLGLEYFGIDCSIDPQGRLLVFEADTAMIVHAGDEPELFAYKTPHVQRIFDAFQKLIDRVGSR